jgi:dihydropyrimidinase
LLPGADADLVLFDPHAVSKIRHQNLHDNLDYSPYEDFLCQGEPVMTLLRGDVVAQSGKFTGHAGQGRFIARRPFTADRGEPA